MLKYIKFALKLALGYPLYFISGFIPRNKNIWVFGSFDGAYKDNGRYLYEYIINNPVCGIRAIWISPDQNSVINAQKYGEAYTKYSIRGLYYSLVAKVYGFSGGLQDINFFTSKNAVALNLWHGIPIKKIGFDTVNSKHMRKYFEDTQSIFKKIWIRIKYPIFYVKYDFVLAPSKYVADYSFKSAFRVQDENIIIAEYPRVSYLRACKPLEKYQQYSKVFLYVPTWRDDGRDFLEQAQVDFEHLNTLMREYNAIFLMKLHYATKININLSRYENVILLPSNIEPLQLMKTADCLITDYSSIYLDYLVLDKPVIHFCFDLDEYVKTSRELYFDYIDVLAGSKVASYNELYHELSNILNGEDNSKIHRQRLKDKFLVEITSERSSEDIIISAVQQKIGG